MSTNKGHINKWELPEHKPEQTVWENISNKLDAPLTVDPAESLPQHVPPVNIWNNIEKEIGTLSPVTGPYFIKKYLTRITIVLAVIISMVVIFTINYEEELSEDGIKKHRKADESQQTSVIEGNKSLVNKEKNNNVQTKPHVSENTEPEVQASISSDIPGSAKNSDVIAQTSPTINTLTVIDELLPLNYKRKQNRQLYSLPGLSSLQVSQLDTKHYSIFQPEYRLNASRVSRSSNSQSKISLSKFFVNFHIAPELVFMENHEKEHMAWHYDLGLGYHISDFYVESGVGYSHSSCDEKIVFDYLQNELMYKFAKVDSIIYDYDSVTMELNKEFITSDFEVYDSVQYTSDYTSTKKVAFIQVPLWLGYKAKFKKISVFVKAGPLLSVLLNHNKEITVNETGHRVVHVYPEKQCTISTNWQMVLGAGFALNLNKKLSWAVEPQFRYYLDPYYESSAGKLKRPYSISVRTGLYYNF